MKILLIRGPNNKKALDLSHYKPSEPRGLQSLASYFSKNHELEVFDMAFEKVSISKRLENTDYDLCGISSGCNDIFIIKKLAKEIKKLKNIPIFIGGFQVKKTPELFISKYIDYIILETSKKNLDIIIEDVKKKKRLVTGMIPNNNISKETSFVDERFEINRSFTKKYEKDYSYFILKKVALVEFYKNNNIYNELKALKHKNIVFIDWDFFQKEEEIKNFFENLEKEKITKEFLVYGSVKNIKKYLPKFSYFRKLGLKNIIIFFEKEKSEDVYIVKELERNKIKVWGYFNIYPEFTKEDFRILRKYIKKLALSVVTIYPLNPFYDAELLDKYKENLIYKSEMRANRYPGYVLIKPFSMSLKAFYIEILKTICYSYRYSFFKFPFTYGLKNTLKFFSQSLVLFYKFIKIISNYSGISR